ncbi:MAG: glutamate--tRNA ligase [Candidatus Eisenbacteria bacterium]|nr:glutamate--tRNA ligase [Candidatus Latescibacterota bacterium]MBD3303196.1 glutamate--tRNA ligase [Candidatus Eisenbacteria bacterium]
MSELRVRFAPSPTGMLHVGGARTALFNWLHARNRRGTFVLRIEDTDRARSTEESIQAIYEGMRWLGLDWDEGPDVGGPYGPYLQSERRPEQIEAAQRLLEAARAYRCYCTPEDLERRRAARLEGGESQVGYDGTCRKEIGKPARDEPFAIRLLAPDEGEIVWEDLCRGEISFQAETLEDFVIVRSDGSPTYNFAAVVDDAAMKITDVLRGDDHISNTPRQILAYRALELPAPRFGHVPMILGPDGTRLSKRHGATSVTAYREQGILPDALFNFLALLGWAYDDSRELFTREELIEVFTLEKLGKTPSTFNQEKLEWMNGVYMAALPIEEKVAIARAHLESKDLLRHLPDEDAVRRLVEALGERFKMPHDVIDYADFLFTDRIVPDEEGRQRAAQFPEGIALLPELASRLESLERFEGEQAEEALRGLAKEKGRKAGDLIHPSRIALTGKKHGLSIFDVMLLLGRERTIRRLRAFASEAAGD